MYNKPVSEITTQDLQDLLDSEATENIRLEFKSQVPSNDEMLKKLSSFANTFGGYLIVGAAEDGQRGKLTSLPGVDAQSNYKQRVLATCFTGIYPPLTPEVSEPVISPSDPNKFCYVIYIPESEQAPHFLNGRKGIYIRTDEHSQKFEAKLAKQDELLELFERRKAIIHRRDTILERARRRFDRHIHNSGSGLGPNLHLAIVPKFPSVQIGNQSTILKASAELRFTWRRVDFPLQNSGPPVSQNESALLLNPAGDTSLFEMNVWGLMSYASKLEWQSPSEGIKGIHVHSFLGHLAAYLKHSSMFTNNLEINCRLKVILTLEGILNIPWIYASPYGTAVEGPASVLDDDFTVSLEIDATELIENYEEIFKRLIELVFYSMNWPKQVNSPKQLEILLDEANKYNFWRARN